MRSGGTLRRARLCLAVGLLALGAVSAGQAHADVVDRPLPAPRPVRVIPYIEGENSAITASGLPDHAFFVAVNPRGAPITVSIESLVLLGAGGNVTLGVRGISDDDGHRLNPRSVSIPAHGRVRVTVVFGGVPAARINDQRYVVRLAARVAGSVLRVDSTISRMTRHPWHHH